MPSTTPPTEVYGEPTETRERRRRSLATFLVVLLLLFFAVWYALSYIRADEDRRAHGPAPSASATCSLSPKDVQVNVYNATTRDGLAGRVADQLEKRGFVVKTVANDPKKAKVSGVGQLRFGPKGEAGARLVAAHLSETKEVRDKRRRTTVDVVLGPGFTSLVSPDLATRRGC